MKYVSTKSRMNILKTRSLLKRYFGTAEKLSKTKTVKHALGRYFKRFGTVEKSLKTRTVNCAFCCYFIRYFDLQRIVLRAMKLNGAF